MEVLLRRDVGGRDGRRVAVVAVTERADGDVNPERVDPDVLRRRQLALTDRPWVMLDEVHGTTVYRADGTSGRTGPIAGRGDVLLAEQTDDVLAIWAGDCAPIALLGADGATRVLAHAGWRGLAGGVLDVAVEALESAGTTVAVAVLGPCIHACCYEFGAEDLERVAAGVGVDGDVVVGTTAWGSTALDVPAAVRAGLARRGVRLDAIGACTGCDDRFHSHRRRAESGRHALVSWFEPHVAVPAIEPVVEPAIEAAS
jgi:purine-nucleoside/S-methyl-5'-thioadenosine phosphorylase / adenosine deaminase